MTHTEITELLANEVGSTFEEAHGFVQSFIDIVISRLDAGDEVKIRGLGSFRWEPVQGQKVPRFKRKYLGVTHLPGGLKLKFTPSKKFRARRPVMAEEDEGMNKYAVVTEGESDDKTASDDTIRVCPVCASELDSGGACPKHGTKPFEPDGQ